MLSLIHIFVAQISLSKIINMDGRMKITTNILMIAPRAIRIHRELIISILEYMPTPKVAAKKLSALTMIDWMELRSAVAIASFLLSLIHI